VLTRFADKNIHKQTSNGEKKIQYNIIMILFHNNIMYYYIDRQYSGVQITTVQHYDINFSDNALSASARRMCDIQPVVIEGEGVLHQSPSWSYVCCEYCILCVFVYVCVG